MWQDNQGNSTWMGGDLERDVVPCANLRVSFRGASIRQNRFPSPASPNRRPVMRPSLSSFQRHPHQSSSTSLSIPAGILLPGRTPHVHPTLLIAQLAPESEFSIRTTSNRVPFATVTVRVDADSERSAQRATSLRRICIPPRTDVCIVPNSPSLVTRSPVPSYKHQQHPLQLESCTGLPRPRPSRPRCPYAPRKFVRTFECCPPSQERVPGPTPIYRRE